MKMNEQLGLAYEVAAKFHAGQKYGKEDYMYHLESVANNLKRENDDRLAVIGLLHDILEDTTCTEETLRALFDKDIVDAVIALTKWWVHGESYEDYIGRCRANALARRVKMYDSAANMDESMLRGDMKRVLKYSKQIQLLAE